MTILTLLIACCIIVILVKTLPYFMKSNNQNIKNQNIYTAASLGAIGCGCGAVLIIIFSVLSFSLPFILLGMFLGGMIGGISLRNGWKTIIGFGFGYVFSGITILISSVAPQAMSNESTLEIFFGFTLLFTIGFVLLGIAGIVSTKIMRKFSIYWFASLVLCGIMEGIMYSQMLTNKLLITGVVLSVLVPYSAMGAATGTIIALARQTKGNTVIDNS